MSRSHHIPTYRLHKPSGRAVVELPDGTGQRVTVYLGHYGTAQSKARYAQVIAEWQANRQTLAAADSPQSHTKHSTIAELTIAFWVHVERHYRRADGTATNEQNDFRLSLRPLVHLYGAQRAAEFTPLKLKAVRELMVNGYQHAKYGHQRSLARGVVNQRVSRIRRMFKWAVENEIVRPDVLQGLLAVKGLQAGRTEARETEPVQPVPRAVVDATLPHLQPMVADMVRLQLETGMRPGELVIMRACDLDMTGDVWEYRPHHHKTIHRGGKRVVSIGPRGQQIIKRYLRTRLDAYLFSPIAVREEMDAQRRRARRSPMTPSQARRQRKARPRRAPRDRYSTDGYGKAITRACDFAFPPPDDLSRRADESIKRWRKRLTADQNQELLAWRRAHRWHPHQLRHTRATEIRKEAGLDTARAVLGHTSPVVTEVYAELDRQKAQDIMARLG